MRRLIRMLLRLALVLLLLIVAALAVLYFLTERRIARTYQVTVPSFTVPQDEAAVTRGERLARIVVPCWECHGEDYGGKLAVNDVAMGRLAARTSRAAAGASAPATPTRTGRGSSCTACGGTAGPRSSCPPMSCRLPRPIWVT
jgi:hypothetical protein